MSQVFTGATIKDTLWRNASLNLVFRDCRIIDCAFIDIWPGSVVRLERCFMDRLQYSGSASQPAVEVGNGFTVIRF